MIQLLIYNGLLWSDKSNFHATKYLRSPLYERKNQIGERIEYDGLEYSGLEYSSLEYGGLEYGG